MLRPKVQEAEPVQGKGKLLWLEHPESAVAVADLQQIREQTLYGLTISKLGFLQGIMGSQGGEGY